MSREHVAPDVGRITLFAFFYVNLLSPTLASIRYLFGAEERARPRAQQCKT